MSTQAAWGFIRSWRLCRPFLSYLKLQARIGLRSDELDWLDAYLALSRIIHGLQNDFWVLLVRNVVFGEINGENKVEELLLRLFLTFIVNRLIKITQPRLAWYCVRTEKAYLKYREHFVGENQQHGIPAPTLWAADRTLTRSTPFSRRSPSFPHLEEVT